MKYSIFLSVICVFAYNTVQSASKKYMPSPITFQKKPAKNPEYKSITEQMGESVKRINPALNQDLYRAIIYNDLSGARLLLDRPEIPDVNSRIVNAFSNVKSPKMLQLLINAGLDVNKKFDGKPALFFLLSQACYGSQFNASSQDERQWQLKMAKILLDSGVDINAQDNDGITPLMYAVEYPMPALVRLFLQAGADINIKDGAGKTVLDYALELHPDLKKSRNFEIERILKDFIKLQTKEQAKLAQSAIAKSLKKVSGAQDVSRIVHSYIKPVPTMRISEELTQKVQEEAKKEKGEKERHGFCTIM